MLNYNNVIDEVALLAVIILAMPLLGLSLYLALTKLTPENLKAFYLSLMDSWFKLP